MCYGMGCPYERIGGPNAGTCTCSAGGYPDDAACQEPPEYLRDNPEEEDDGI